jgi:multiple sugar transport system substrate-binding protein
MLERPIWIASLLLFLAGCGNSGSTSDRVRVWAIGAEGENLGVLARQFEKEYPHIRLDLQTIPWSAAHEKLIIAVAGGTEPDICQLGNTWMPEFHAMGALAPLDSFLAASSIVNADNYFAGPWATNVFDASVYGVPWYVETRVLFYRTDLLTAAGFDDAPATWEELYRAAQQLTRDDNGDGKPDRYGITLPVNVWEQILFFTWGADGRILADDLQTPAVTSPQTREAWEYYVRFFRDGLVPVESGLLSNLFQAFESGRYAMFISGPWMLTQLRQNCPSIADKWNVAMMPRFRTRDSLAGGSNLVIFRRSRQKAAAWQFIEYLSRPEIQLQWYRITSDLPAVKLAWEDSLLSRDPKIQVFYQQLQHTRPAPQVPEWEQIASRINRWLEVAVYGRASVDEALRGLSRDIRRIMRKRGANKLRRD